METRERLLRRFYRRLNLFLLVFINITISLAQNIPLGHWEAHYSYLSAQHVVHAGNRIYCSSYNGLFSVNPENAQVKLLSKADGLSEVGISSMAYNDQDNSLLLVYRSRNIDLIRLNSESEFDKITPWPVLINAAELPADKKTNKILYHENIAYLATNFGIVVLDTRLLNVVETYRYIGSRGTQVQVKDIAFASDSIYVLTPEGILASSMLPSVNRQYFANWKMIPSPYPVIAFTSQSDNIYAGFPGKGIFKRTGKGIWTSVYSGKSQYYSFSNVQTGIVATLDKNVVVIPVSGEVKSLESVLFDTPKESLITEKDIVWTADSRNGLLGNVEGDFSSYSPAETDTTIHPKTDSIIIDQNGLEWARLPPYLGGGISVKNTGTNKQRILTTVSGNGGLPSSIINSLAMDQDGYIWFGSDKGAGYFFPDDILSGTNADAILPVYGQRKLFANEKCTALAVEPGNRKWIGTRNGLYLFNGDGTELLEKFTAAESPLPSDQIIALRFDHETGMLFVDTPNGMVSYRSNSTAAAQDLSSITIFPNPVRPGFAGQIGIKGLMDKSIVKITQLSGRLVYETRSEGGTASWNLNDYTGKRVKGGIYMVLIVSGNGEKKLAGKLAVID